MAYHPLNLALAFLLELAALAAMGYGGWHHNSGWRYVLAFGVPLLAAACWGIFRVPNDPKAAPVQVPGFVRLLLEVAFFGGATWALFSAGQRHWALWFGGIVLAHYALSWDRLVWLLKQ